MTTVDLSKNEKQKELFNEVMYAIRNKENDLE